MVFCMKPNRLRQAAFAIVLPALGYAVGRRVDGGRESGLDVGGGAAVVSGVAGVRGGVEVAAGVRGFDGTVGGLIAIAKAAKTPWRAQWPLQVVLMPLGAEEIAKLTRAAPWRQGMLWHEAAVMDVLVRVWAEKDAVGALAWASQALPVYRRTDLRGEILKAYGAVDMDRALALARKITPEDDRRAAMCQLAEALAATEPERALGLISSQGGDRYFHFAANIFRTWAAADPLAAWSKAVAWPHNANRASACEVVLSQWVATDRAGAWAVVQGMPAGNGKRQAIAAVYTAWAMSAPAEAHAAVLAMPLGSERNAAQMAALQGWAQSDPRSAAAALADMPGGNQRSQMTNQVFSAWAMQDPAAAAAAAAELPFKQRQEAMTALAGTWAWKDPRGAMAWAKSITDPQMSSQALSNIFPALVRDDPQMAASEWRALPRKQQREQLHEMTSTWAQQDKEGALAFARSLEQPQDRAAALSAAASGLGFEDPAALTKVLSEIPEGPLRVEAMQRITGEQWYQNPEGVTDWLKTLPESARAGVMRDNNHWLTQMDPKAAAALLETTPGLEGQQYLWSQIAGNLASEDPAAGLAWAEKIEAPGARTAAVSQALGTMAQQDPLGAAQHAAGIANEETRRGALGSVVDVWAEQDPDAAMAWAANAGPEAQQMVMLKATIAKAGDDPAASAAMLAKMAGGGQQKDDDALQAAARGVAGNYFRDDMKGSVAWAAGLPEGAAQTAAVESIAGAWTQLDPVEASGWIQQLPPGAGRDGAAEKLSYGIMQSDPESAFTWAASIGADTKRDNALRQVARNWMSADKAGARAAIQGAAISESLRAELLEE